VLAAIVDLPANVGYAAVFALIAVETMGIPVPGETALIAAALLAHDGQMSIAVLVAIAAAAAILGDNVGFAIGRKGGRKLFARPGLSSAAGGRCDRDQGSENEQGEGFFHGARSIARPP